MNKLWYKKQAKLWNEALPLGNGHTGVMVWGGRRKETLCFNDVTLWSGFPKNQDNPESLENLERVRQLIFAGKPDEAHDIVESKLCGCYSEAYTPLGDLKISFSSLTTKGYTRELDIDNAVHTVSFKGEKRTAFASYPDDVVVYKSESEKPVNITVEAKSKIKSKTVVKDGYLCLCGNAPDISMPSYLGKIPDAVIYGDKGMAFCLAVKVVTDGEVIYSDKKITVKNSTSTVLLATTATGFIAYDKMPETDREAVRKACIKKLANVKPDYDKLLKKHVADYRKIFDRQSFSIGGTSEEETVRLLETAKKGKPDAKLVELFYNYGKYLMIAGSRKGGQPLNLQGIWNARVRPPWSSNYTVNINTEMNYWPVSKSNMAECAEPFVNLAWELMQTGRSTAKTNYGCKGACCNHNTDLWRKTSPVEGDPCYMFSPLCGAWLVNEVYGHYKNGGLDEYKDKIFESVKASAEFINDYLVEFNGEYVVAPSTSPENEFSFNGRSIAIDCASAFDMEVARKGLLAYLDFESEGELAKQIKEKLAKLRPLKKGSTGIMEWSKDYELHEPGHRHFSPLYGLYPSDTIKYYENEEQREWVRELYHFRKKNWERYIGWSAAWAICLAGTLHEPDTASEIIANMLTYSVFSNLFDTHPPFLFQIDGNFGFTAGVNALLVYSENGKTELLPALPSAWENGEVRNMLINGAQLSFKWKNGKVVSVSADKPVILMNLNLAEDCKTGKNITVE
ncbi:MAG: glycoside hydrolase family 95 protein [Clostridia bacterium]|nr:glycoside hydrolase family 95 protein [Clostridia bacterium]